MSVWPISSLLCQQSCAPYCWFCSQFILLVCSGFCRPAFEGESRSPPWTPACPGESVTPHSWPWTGCTCGTVLGSVHLHTASHATGGRGLIQACGSQSDHSVDTSCTSAHLLHPSLSLPDQILLEKRNCEFIYMKHRNIICNLIYLMHWF